MIYNRKRSLIIITLILIITLISGCSIEIIDYAGDDSKTAEQNVDESGELYAHFLDVGQGDAILVRLPGGKNMLIDAGPNSSSDKVVGYLKKEGIKKIDVLVGTHPHEDHIGGMAEVIKNFDIGSIYMPKVTHTSKTYKRMLEAIKGKNLKINSAIEGMDIPLEGVEAKILAPSKDMSSDNLNDYSVVIRLVYKDTVFIFQGDAEAKTEERILDGAYDIHADVIKIGHHGSRTSSTKEYIDKVNPKYAVLMLAEGNDYGHPHRQTMELLKGKGITIYRTDQCGTIVAKSDGNEISFNCKPGDYSYPKKK